MRFRWLPEHELLLIRYEGVLGLEDLEAHVKETSEAVQGRSRRILVDHRTSELTIGVEGLKRFFESVAATEFYRRDAKRRRIAGLSLTPANTALNMVFANWLPEGIEGDVFSTVERACGFLDLELDFLREHEDIIPIEIEPGRFR